ncbi:MAG: threonine synthase [Alphaproteobacteria bacterium]|nr:threonine synthase [Alphaproteobacteria bacterium]
MEYISTRGEAPAAYFEEVLLRGLAPDGGLYVPRAWPHLSRGEIEALRGLSYADLAAALLAPFVGEAVAPGDLERILADGAAAMGHAAVTPLVQLDERTFLLELFHGPTLAFKDVALQLLGRLFAHVLERRGEALTILGATSGDTGSAAIEAVRGRANMEIFILHPKDRVSRIQRLQMTTVAEPNVHNIALEGTFDDCQAIVKALFADADLRDELALSSINSINWARIMAQIVYYFASALALGAPERPVAFSVPTGNFGDVYAGYAAARMGLPVERLLVATNVNDILERALRTGEYEVRDVVATMSPSMDIQVASNFERLLFDAHDRNARSVQALMARLRETGRFTIDEPALATMRAHFSAARVSEEATLGAMRRAWTGAGELVDPHTAVALAALDSQPFGREVARVVLATAHPAKFPDPVEKATGVRPALPARLAGLEERAESFAVLPNDVSAVRDFLRRARAPR